MPFARFAPTMPRTQRALSFGESICLTGCKRVKLHARYGSGRSWLSNNRLLVVTDALGRWPRVRALSPGVATAAVAATDGGILPLIFRWQRDSNSVAVIAI